MWKLVKVVVDGNEVLIDGYNVWYYEWKILDEVVEVKDPLYGETKILFL